MDYYKGDQMQYLDIDSIQIISILIASWFVAFISSYIITYAIIIRWKIWEEMNEKEHSWVIGTFSLGTFPGIIVWWILGTGAFTNTPVFGIFEILIMFLWVVVLIFAAALGGSIVIRR